MLRRTEIHSIRKIHEIQTESHPILDFTKLWAEAALAASSQNVEKFFRAQVAQATTPQEKETNETKKRKGRKQLRLQTIYKLFVDYL